MEQFDEIIELVPQFFHSEILKYSLIRDRIRCLIGKIFVYKNYLDDSQSKDSFVKKWFRDQNNKPQLKSWKSFNISHSGDFVIYAESSNHKTLGIDLEKINKEVNVLELISFFLIEERQKIQESDDPTLIFFRLWVRKEALLKASGIGIVNGLNTCNCLKDEIYFDQELWTILDIPFYDGYFLSLASHANHENVYEIQQFDNNLLNFFL